MKSFSCSNINGSIVQIDGRTAIINGKKYTLPPNNNTSIINGVVFVNGRKFEPDEHKKLRQTPKVLQRVNFTTDPTGMNVIDIASTLTISGVTNVTLLPSETPYYHGKVELDTWGTKKLELNDLREIDLTDWEDDIESCEVTLHIPTTGTLRTLRLNNCNELDARDVQTSSLNIQCNGLSDTKLTCCVVGDVTNQGNSELTVTSCTVANVTHQSMSHEVSIRDSIVNGSCTTKTMSGNVDVMNTKMLSTYHMATMSGDVLLHELTSKFSGQVQTMSGDVRIVGCEAPSVSVHTMSGSLRGSGKTQVSFITMSGKNSYRHQS